MTAKQAMETLERFNRWRRHDRDEPMEQPDPTQVGLAIEAAIGALALLPEGWDLTIKPIQNEEG